MPSQPNILIVGPNGSGKSNSLENLLKSRPKDIAFIDVERKGLPFKVDLSSLCYFSEPEDRKTGGEAMDFALSEKCAARIVVLDSISELHRLFYKYSRDGFTGFEIFNTYNSLITKYFGIVKKSTKIFITTGVDEIVKIDMPEGGTASRVRCAVTGKEWEGKIEGQFLIVLSSIPKKNSKTGLVEFKFETKSDTVRSSKCPTWLGLDGEIPNDVSLVVDKLLPK